MSYEVHDIISRDDAWKLWKQESGSYGDRVIGQLDGSLDAGAISPAEAACIAYGADCGEQTEIFGEPLPYYDIKSARKHLEDLRQRVAAGANGGLIKLIAASHERQREAVGALRETELESGLQLIRTLGAAVVGMADQGYWDKQQADEMTARLLAPDGSPLMQFTPMTILEWARRATGPMYKYERGENELLSPLQALATPEFGTGIIRYPVSLAKMPLSYGHWKIHEHVHLMTGAELFVPVDGAEYASRAPWVRFLGVHRQPWTYDEPGSTLPQVPEGGFRPNEGDTDDMAQELIWALRGHGLDVLPVPDDRNGYVRYVDWRRQVRAASPELSRAITRAALTESTPQTPDAKREELLRMHQIADREYGRQHALDYVV